MVIYQVAEVVKDVYNHFDGLQNNVDYDHLPLNVDKIKVHADDNANWSLHNCVLVKISTASCPPNIAEKLQQMGEECAYAENNIKRNIWFTSSKKCYRESRYIKEQFYPWN